MGVPAGLCPPTGSREAHRVDGAGPKVALKASETSSSFNFAERVLLSSSWSGAERVGGAAGVGGGGKGPLMVWAVRTQEVQASR